LDNNPLSKYMPGECLRSSSCWQLFSFYDCVTIQRSKTK